MPLTLAANVRNTELNDESEPAVYDYHRKKWVRLTGDQKVYWLNMAATIVDRMSAIPTDLAAHMEGILAAHLACLIEPVPQDVRAAGVAITLPPAPAKSSGFGHASPYGALWTEMLEGLTEDEHGAGFVMVPYVN